MNRFAYIIAKTRKTNNFFIKIGCSNDQSKIAKLKLMTMS